MGRMGSQEKDCSNDTMIYTSNYEKAYHILMEYFDYIPEDERSEVDNKLKELEL